MMPMGTRFIKYAVGCVLAMAGVYILYNALSIPLYLASAEGAIIAFMGVVLILLAAIVVLKRPAVGRSEEPSPEEGETENRPVQPITDATLETRRDYTMATMGMAPTFIDPRMRDEPVTRRRD